MEGHESQLPSSQTKHEAWRQWCVACSLAFDGLIPAQKPTSRNAMCGRSPRAKSDGFRAARYCVVCTVVLERYLDVLGGEPVGAWERSLLTGEGIPRVRLPHCPALLAPRTFQVDSTIRASHILFYVQTQMGAFTSDVLIWAWRFARH